MKQIFITLVLCLSGCAEVRVLDVDFTGNNCVRVNGKEFSLKSKAEGFVVRSSFPEAQEIIFRNVDKCLISDVWCLMDVEYPDENYDVGGMRPILEYRVVLRNGKLCPIKWFGRYSDPQCLYESSIGTCYEVDCAEFSGSFQSVTTDDAYLQIWFDVMHTTGRAVLDVIEKFCEAGGAGHDIYLVPY